ncbi:translation elongation factor Ts [Luteolibacter sp. GHJ8]|uniref:Elongation factor Ts n=1 Tax=Luteolibacter rhizosphaerae TaxID=2989719 RepID=A0ABT3GA37_9BACT|nr:translation elongation factor Ts [Luteolibacter rhizosphaerae]MCW1916366.1 translation elongation factor Ts [Luteolibacter rhizosphaerae]
MITASLVNELRKKTNVGMMECKKALTETNGDIDAAVTYLRERGMMKAAAKADREASEGIIAARLSGDGKTGILIEVNCETDFVSRNDNYVAFVGEIADTLAASSAKTLEEALAVKIGDISVEDFVKAKTLELGENMRLRKFERFDLQDGGAIAQYIHMGGKVGVLLEVSASNGETASKEEFRDLVKDITLHIAAAAPKGLSRDEITADIIEAEKSVYRAQLAAEGKPEAMIEKIVEGKIGKFFSEAVLLEQAFVKDPETSIKKLVEAKGKEVGDTLVVKRFVRFGLGE